MDLDLNKTIIDVIERACRTYSAQPAFTAVGHTLTFAELDALTAQFANYLQHATDLVPGDRVAVQLPNLLQYPVVTFGALRAGMVVVNVNPLYTERELEHQLNDSGAKALVVLENVAHTAAHVVPMTGVHTVITTQIGDIHPGVKRWLINTLVKYVKRQVPRVAFATKTTLPDALNEGLKYQLNPVTVTPDDLAVLQYTGGTTGVAKGAMLTHRNLVANKQQVLAHMPDEFDGGGNTFIAPLPLYHIYAFTVHCMAAFSSGNHSLLIPNPRDIPGFVKSLRDVSIDRFIGINTLFNALCDNTDFNQLDFSSLRSTLSGGMALNTDTAQRWQDITGCEVREGYGLTETSPVISAARYGANQPGTVGEPVLATDIAIRDEEGNDLERGEPGELCVKGPQVMKGYWQRPEETAKVLSDDGWLRTGDIAVWQEDGFLKIVDRLKDMIIVSGLKVFPNEVEDVVALHPDVLECAVIGVSDPASGEAVKLFVVSRDHQLSAEELQDFCRERLAPYKVPHLVEFRDELPKSNVGKILRKELRE